MSKDVRRLDSLEKRVKKLEDMLDPTGPGGGGFGAQIPDKIEALGDRLAALESQLHQMQEVGFPGIYQRLDRIEAAINVGGSEMLTSSV